LQTDATVRLRKFEAVKNSSINATMGVKKVDPINVNLNGTQKNTTATNATANATMKNSTANATVKKVAAKPVAAKRHSTENKAVIDRPNIGKGPTMVTFGMMGKTFYGVDVMHNQFTIDLVLTLSWHDPRTVKLIPKGASTIQLSQEEASNEVWLPEIVVTDQSVHNSVQIVSTAVELHEDGTVVKVQRQEVMVEDKYNLKEYPFDSQPLRVKLASSQYMTPELQLVPSSDEAWSGMPAKLFDGSGWDLKHWKIEVIEDNNGLLKKSRGVLTVDVKT